MDNKYSEIEHLPEMKVFRMKIDENNIGEVNYSVGLDGKYSLTHAQVPYQLRGHGVGKELVEKTFDYLKQNEIKSIALCSYIRAIVKRSDKWQELVEL